MRQFLFLIFLTAFFSTNLAHAADRIDLSFGNSVRPSDTSPLINSFRAGVSWDTDYFKTDNDRFPRSLRIESSLGLNQNDYKDIKDFMVAPVLHYQLNPISTKTFFEVSVGAAYLSDDHWEPTRNLGSNWLFADRIGVGQEFEKFEISINFFHFSNAGLSSHNPGADMLLLRTSVKL